MEIMIISALSIVLIFLAFITGLHYGSKVKNNEIIEIPNPVKSVKKHIEETKEKVRLDKEQEIMETNLRNIENYNGTEIGQIDIPR